METPGRSTLQLNLPHPPLFSPDTYSSPPSSEKLRNIRSPSSGCCCDLLLFPTSDDVRSGCRRDLNHVPRWARVEATTLTVNRAVIDAICDRKSEPEALAGECCDRRSVLWVSQISCY
ncbi:hypothetical protein CEXT_191261 [Caerostris extrusa]|uniref:Uncharacterized protein n=1 Tax=Caerostris extrusa TaxID=172846 RepID=A0AAV4N6C4_CAEEX|nr:hypothetical protein CEXT_191261 [Caerostris extrusa]